MVVRPGAVVGDHVVPGSRTAEALIAFHLECGRGSRNQNGVPETCYSKVFRTPSGVQSLHRHHVQLWITCRCRNFCAIMEILCTLTTRNQCCELCSCCSCAQVEMISRGRFERPCTCRVGTVWSRPRRYLLVCVHSPDDEACGYLERAGVTSRRTL